jgi:hypothetical protein
VTVTFPARNYNAGSEAAAAEPAPGKEKVKAGDSKTVVQLSQVVQREYIDGTLGLQELVDLLARAYQRVEPTRRKKL